MMRTHAWLGTVLGAAVGLAGCASGPKVQERGWLGGRLADVVAEGAFHPAPTIGGGATPVVGLPHDVAQGGAALVVGAWPGTPLAAAGLAPGDLVLAVDGRPVESSEDVRAAFAAKAPGASGSVSYVRAGDARTAEVVTGRETWERVGSIRLGIGLSSTLDLWPFDDGIDILGLVQFRTGGAAPDLAGPESAYLRGAFPDRPVVAPPGAGWDVFVLPIGGGVRERVTAQEMVPR